MNNSFTNAVATTPMEELTNYHQQLIKQFSDPKSQVSGNVDTPKLIPFNGYYTLDAATGAFFAIDTDMIITPTATEPQYVLSLLISLDGTTSKRYKFTGTFDGSQLLQDSAKEGLGLSLTFSRNSSSTYGPTATCKGNIVLLGQQALHVKGSTYNNPIPASLFMGDYYNTPVAGKPPLKVMSIGSDNTLFYDNGANDDEKLHAVKTYAYNLNMYYFSFCILPYTKVQLIMGTAAAQGFACNNMSIIGSNLTTRSLTTIPSGVAPKPQLYDLSGVTLADFSGYYQIKEHPKAFVSIQAQYISTGGSMELELNFVMISYSLDGKTSFGHYFDPLLGMKFDATTNTLTIPSNLGKPELLLTFNREYKPYNDISGSLVSVTGDIEGNTVSGATLFNPVPLSVFGGVTMTNKNKDALLTINSDNSFTYATKSITNTNNVMTTNTQTKTFTSFIYVPLMYIVAAPADAPTLELSLGTDGLRGNVSIVITDINTPSPKTSSVNAINGPEY